MPVRPPDLAGLPAFPALQNHSGLVSMARDQSVRMSQRGSIPHDTNLSGTISSLGLQWLLVGENVGVGPDVDLIQQALLHSPGHYANIVKREYTALGVGVVRDGGRVYVTQVFAQMAGAPAPPPPPPTPPPPPPPTPPPPSPEPNAVMEGVVSEGLVLPELSSEERGPEEEAQRASSGGAWGRIKSLFGRLTSFLPL